MVGRRRSPGFGNGGSASIHAQSGAGGLKNRLWETVDRLVSAAAHIGPIWPLTRAGLMGTNTKRQYEEAFEKVEDNLLKALQEERDFKKAKQSHEPHTTVEFSASPQSKEKPLLTSKLPALITDQPPETLTTETAPTAEDESGSGRSSLIVCLKVPAPKPTTRPLNIMPVRNLAHEGVLTTEGSLATDGTENGLALSLTGPAPDAPRVDSQSPKKEALDASKFRSAAAMLEEWQRRHPNTAVWVPVAASQVDNRGRGAALQTL